MRRFNYKKAAICSSATLLFGCAMLKGLSFIPNFDKFKEEYKAGNYEQAINYIMPENTPTFDRSALGTKATIVGMEAGVAALTAAKLEDSTKYLDITDSTISGGFSFTTYIPKYYDKIMVNTYKGLAFWGLGNVDNAGAEFRRLNERQKEAVEEHQKEIARAEERAKSEENAESFALVQGALDKEYKVYKNFKPYADFTNPFSTYLSSLYYLTAGYDKSEVENAVNYMRRVKTMTSNKYISSDLKMAEDVADGKSIGSNVWVIYEEGMAPVIKAKVIKIPFPTKTGIKVANLTLPEFVSQPHSYRNLSASTTDGTYGTQSLSDMERVIKTEYQKRYPAEVAKAVVWMVTNLAAQELASRAITKSKFAKKLDKKMAKHGGLVGKLGKHKLGSKALASAASVAISEMTYPLNTTSWSTLPKEIQMAKFKMPANRKVKLTASNGRKIADVEIDEKIKNAIIYVRSPEANGHTNWFVIDAGGK